MGVAASNSMSEAIIKPEQILLPFAAREYIDTRRACRILGLWWPSVTLTRMAETGLIEWLDMGKGSWKRVRYKTVVDFCDRLRDDHKIADRRPKLSPHLRHRDEDLLPFPLTDTITAQQALDALGFLKTDSLVRRIEEGCFDAYQLVPWAPTPWRVSRSSLIAYMDRLRSPAVTNKVYRGSPHF